MIFIYTTRSNVIGGTIRKLRKEFRYSKKTVAELLDLTLKEYKNIESGTSDIGLNRLMAICDEFSVDISEFVSQIDGNIKHIQSSGLHVAKGNALAISAKNLVSHLD